MRRLARRKVMVQVHDLGDHLVSNIPLFLFHYFTVRVSLELHTSAPKRAPHQTHCKRGGNIPFRVHKARAQKCVVWSGAENFAYPLEPAAAHTVRLTELGSKLKFISLLVCGQNFQHHSTLRNFAPEPCELGMVCSRLFCSVFGVWWSVRFGLLCTLPTKRER